MANLQRLTLSVLMLILTVCTAATAGAQAPVVLFDEAHNQQFLVLTEGELALTELGKIFAAQEFTIRTSREPLTEAILANVDAVVISGPFAPFSAPEIETLYNFVEKGGRLAIMLHVAPIISNLLSRFDVVHSNGSIREAAAAQIDGQAQNFQVSLLETDQLFTGIDRFGAYGCWALESNGKLARIAAKTSDQSWIDLNKDRIYSEQDPMQSFGVVALGEIGKGNFVIFGDDAIFQNRFLKNENRQLAENLVQRLKP